MIVECHGKYNFKDHPDGTINELKTVEHAAEFCDTKVKRKKIISNIMSHAVEDVSLELAYNMETSPIIGITPADVVNMTKRSLATAYNRKRHDVFPDLAATVEDLENLILPVELATLILYELRYTFLQTK